jgi:hypothetical protein
LFEILVVLFGLAGHKSPLATERYQHGIEELTAAVVEVPSVGIKKETKKEP